LPRSRASNRRLIRPASQRGDGRLGELWVLAQRQPRGTGGALLASDSGQRGQQSHGHVRRWSSPIVSQTTRPRGAGILPAQHDVDGRAQRARLLALLVCRDCPSRAGPSLPKGGPVRPGRRPRSAGRLRRDPCGTFEAAEGPRSCCATRAAPRRRSAPRHRPLQRRRGWPTRRPDH